MEYTVGGIDDKRELVAGETVVLLSGQVLNIRFNQLLQKADLEKNLKGNNIVNNNEIKFNIRDIKEVRNNNVVTNTRKTTDTSYNYTTYNVLIDYYNTLQNKLDISKEQLLLIANIIDTSGYFIMKEGKQLYLYSIDQGGEKKKWTDIEKLTKLCNNIIYEEGEEIKNRLDGCTFDTLENIKVYCKYLSALIINEKNLNEISNIYLKTKRYEELKQYFSNGNRHKVNMTK